MNRAFLATSASGGRPAGPGSPSPPVRRRPCLFRVSLLVIAAALAGCTHRHARPDRVPPGPGLRVQASVGRYAYDPAPSTPPSESLLADRDEFSIHRIHFPERAGSFFPAEGVTAVEYRPKGRNDRDRAGLVLLPIQGGDYEVSVYFAEAFASRGYACLRFERRAEWLVADRDLASLASLIREYVVDIRRGLDWWAESGRVDPKRIGLFGVSMGAIIGSMVTALEGSRLEASVLVLGGGPLADILMTADDEEIDAFRRSWLERSGGDADRLRRELHAALDPVDPLPLAPLIRSTPTLMIQGRFDHVVRYALATALWEAAGEPERIVIPTGHYSAVLLIRYIRRKALAWFDRWLVPGP